MRPQAVVIRSYSKRENGHPKLGPMRFTARAEPLAINGRPYGTIGAEIY